MVAHPRRLLHHRRQWLQLPDRPPAPPHLADCRDSKRISLRFRRDSKRLRLELCLHQRILPHQFNNVLIAIMVGVLQCGRAALVLDGRRLRPLGVCSLRGAPAKQTIISSGSVQDPIYSSTFFSTPKSRDNSVSRFPARIVAPLRALPPQPLPGCRAVIHARVSPRVSHFRVVNLGYAQKYRRSMAAALPPGNGHPGGGLPRKRPPAPKWPHGRVLSPRNRFSQSYRRP